MKIYLYCVPAAWPGDVIGYAVGADGLGLASHLSSTAAFSKHDMGLTSDWKHEGYRAAYPDGFELEWVDDPDNHEGLRAALRLNEARRGEPKVSAGAHDVPSPEGQEEIR